MGHPMCRIAIYVSHALATLRKTLAGRTPAVATASTSTKGTSNMGLRSRASCTRKAMGENVQLSLCWISRRWWPKAMQMSLWEGSCISLELQQVLRALREVSPHHPLELGLKEVFCCGASVCLVTPTVSPVCT